MFLFKSHLDLSLHFLEFAWLVLPQSYLNNPFLALPGALNKSVHLYTFEKTILFKVYLLDTESFHNFNSTGEQTVLYPQNQNWVLFAVCVCF